MSFQLTMVTVVSTNEKLFIDICGLPVLLLLLTFTQLYGSSLKSEVGGSEGFYRAGDMDVSYVRRYIRVVPLGREKYSFKTFTCHMGLQHFRAMTFF